MSSNCPARAQVCSGRQRCSTIANRVGKTMDCVSIAAIFALHLLFSVMVLLCFKNTHYGYYRTYHDQNALEVKPYFALYNCLFFFTLLWSVHENQKPGPLQMATVTNLVSIVFDIIVACSVTDGALFFLILNIIFRPFTSFVLLRRSYERKRRFALNVNENVSIGAAIRNLLYNQQPQSGDQEVEEGNVATGKDTVPKLSVFSTISSANRNNTRSQPNSPRGVQNI